MDNNPLGSSVLASELKFRCLRIELLENCCSDELEFQDIAATLALHVVGAHGLPYAEMLKRQEKLAYYAQLAAVSKMTVKFRTAKMMRARDRDYTSATYTSAATKLCIEQGGLRKRRGVDNGAGSLDTCDEEEEEDDVMLDHLISEAIQQSHKTCNARPGGTEMRPRAASSLAEICLSSLPDADLERSIADLEAMLSTISDDCYLSSARCALQQLICARRQTPPAWPIERPKHR